MTLFSIMVFFIEGRRAVVMKNGWLELVAKNVEMLASLSSPQQQIAVVVVERSAFDRRPKWRPSF
jgi:hypothetical protein